MSGSCKSSHYEGHKAHEDLRMSRIAESLILRISESLNLWKKVFPFFVPFVRFVVRAL
jgi:hypothetical protein